MQIFSRPLVRVATTALVAILMPQIASAQIAYPTTRKVDHVDTYHSEKIADPYRWLEDDNSAETKAWVQAQNAVTRKILDAIPERASVQKRYTELYNFEKYGLPFKEGGRYFWDRNDGLQQQSVLYTAESLTATPRVLLDPNTLSKDGTVSIAFTTVSRDGRYLAYGVSTAGSDWTEIRVRDVVSGNDLPDRIQWVKFSGVDWAPDGSGFYYSAYDAPKASEKLTGQNFFQKAYFHKLGDPQSKDTLVYQRKDKKDWGFGVFNAEDGKHVFASVWRGSERKNGLLWATVGKKVPTQRDFKALSLDFDAAYSVIGSRGDTLWVMTDLNAPFGRVIEIDLKKPERKH